MWRWAKAQVQDLRVVWNSSRIKKDNQLLKIVTELKHSILRDWCSGETVVFEGLFPVHTLSTFSRLWFPPYFQFLHSQNTRKSCRPSVQFPCVVLHLPLWRCSAGQWFISGMFEPGRADLDNPAVACGPTQQDSCWNPAGNKRTWNPYIRTSTLREDKEQNICYVQGLQVCKGGCGVTLQVCWSDEKKKGFLSRQKYPRNGQADVMGMLLEILELLANDNWCFNAPHLKFLRRVLGLQPLAVVSGTFSSPWQTPRSICMRGIYAILSPTAWQMTVRFRSALTVRQLCRVGCHFKVNILPNEMFNTVHFTMQAFAVLTGMKKAHFSSNISEKSCFGTRLTVWSRTFLLDKDLPLISPETFLTNVNLESRKACRGDFKKWRFGTRYDIRDRYFTVDLYK